MLSHIDTKNNIPTIYYVTLSYVFASYALYLLRKLFLYVSVLLNSQNHCVIDFK